uniref:Putative ovule protein n=1 Tax=Solanum chacoense TaxID=4108 RepID=A0A0V0HVC5_SOLCH
MMIWNHGWKCLNFQKLLEVVLRVRGGAYGATKLQWRIVECLVWDKDNSILATIKLFWPKM